MSRKLYIACIIIFATAFAVRILVWQNNQLAMAQVQYVLVDIYKQDARTLASGDLALFLAGPGPPSNANVLLHPPGYPILIASVYALFGESDLFRVFQILLSSFAPIILLLIAWRMFDENTAIAAGSLAAISPQFAYYSGLILPDGISVLPILVALYCLCRAAQDGKLRLAILIGGAVGVSCWFRSNALVLPLFFTLAALNVVSRDRRWKFAITILAAFVLTIAPITLRNFVVFGHFIPLSLGFGATFVEGLGDHDSDGRHGMPSTDEGVMEMDARLAGRPDYIGQLYAPDGIARERSRVRAGFDVVASDPLWFLRGVMRRGSTAFRMERVPVIAAGHEFAVTPPLFYYLNLPLKLFQRLYITAAFLPLVILGLIVLFLDRPRRQQLVILTCVPIYFMTVQALVHTEYRYVLAVPHISMIVVAVALIWLARTSSRIFGPSRAGKS